MSVVRGDNGGITGVSTFLRVTPPDTFKETAGQIPAVFVCVVTKTGIFKPEHDVF